MAGPWYYAWVDPTETTFTDAHKRFDENVYSISLTQQEGEFAALEIDVLNPRVGLLNASRKQWAWLAWDSGGSDGVVPLFFGRLVGIPSDLQAELIRLEFLARPVDWEDRRAALGATLKVAPYWDPIWIDQTQLNDPDVLLEARTALWHIDRVTHEVTISDILQGEEGTLSFGPDDVLADTLSVNPGTAPARRCQVTATVGWDQAATGSIDITKVLLGAAQDADSGDSHNISTYTGDGLAKDWPKKGDNIGGGWSVGASKVTRGDGLWVPKESKRTVLSNGLIADFPSWSFRPHMEVIYDISRTRTEKLTFVLSADVQDVVTDASDDETLTEEFNSTQLEEEIDAADTSSGFAAPIGDVRRRTYFQQERGHRSIEYLLCVARARLIARARCVDATFEIDWRIGFGSALSCRKSVSLTDPHLPGGQILGKIVGYSLSFDGDSGQGKCQINVSAAVGKGNTASPSSGTPSYVDTGYVNDGYQAATGALLSTAAGDVTYTPPDGTTINDDGVDLLALTARKVVDHIQFLGTKAQQAAIIEAFQPDLAAAVDALNQAYTTITLEMVPFEPGPFETDYALTVPNLVVPRMIDLEAAAS